jgi:AhpD family alkylhydroperoxidase
MALRRCNIQLRQPAPSESELDMIIESVLDQMAKNIRYLQPIQLGTGSKLAQASYAQMLADFLPVPLLTLHAPVPELMAGAWSILRESLLASHSPKAEVRTRKEVVAATVSKGNECPFCVDAHTFILHAAAEHEVANAILRGDDAAIRDPELRGLAQWVRAVSTAEGAGEAAPPFAQGEDPALLAEIIGTAVTFHYINRMVNIFLGETLLPLPVAMKGVTGRWLAPSTGKRFVQHALAQGKSLALVPAAELPADLAWAGANPVVAAAFAGFAAIVEQAGESYLSANVRALVTAHVQAWQGEPMGLSRRWVEEVVAEVDAEERAAARLTLLTALASYQVDAGVVESFQSQYPTDAQLLGATAWASFAAARRAGTWIAAPLLNRLMKLEGI